MPSRAGRSTIGAWVPTLAAATFLSACGGGGDGRGGASVVLHDQWGLSAINADGAYERLTTKYGPETEPGSGQTLAAVDSGIDTQHPAFAGNTVTERILSGSGDATGDEISHGTAVASVMAGHPDDAYAEATGAPRGVAWGSDIAMFALSLGRAGGGPYVPITPARLALSDSRRASIVAEVTGWSSGSRSIDFSNMSFGFNGNIERYQASQLRIDFGDTIAALAQAGRSEKTVFVWAAGNAHGRTCDPMDFRSHADLCVEVVENGTTRHRVNASSVEIDAGLPARIPELRGHVIAVVSVGRNGRIAPSSNRCGIAAEWCIAAPGEGVRVAYFGPNRGDGSPGVRSAATARGTSFAAPMVTGGLAVMKHVFRDQLPNTELVSRLLATADDSGIYDNRSVYGQGLMDLDAATAPLGLTTIALGERVGGPGSELAGTRFAPGGALGDGLAQAFAGHEIAAFDSLGAPFWFPLGALAAPAAGRPMPARLRGFAAARREGEPDALRPRLAPLAGGESLSLGVMQAPIAGSAGGHLSLAGGALALRSEARGLGIAAFSTEGMPGRAPASGATLSWRPGGSPLGLAGGWVAERKTALGSSAAGAFGRLSGASAFAGIDGGARVGAWRLGAGAEIGTVRAAARGGMIASVSPLTTSAFALTAQGTLANGDGLEISLAQPLRVEAGRARLSLPTGRTRDGRVLRRTLSAGLEPSGRQIDLAAHWRRSLSAGGEIGLGAVLARQPGHDASADPELTLLAAWRHTF